MEDDLFFVCWKTRMTSLKKMEDNLNKKMQDDLKK